MTIANLPTAPIRSTMDAVTFTTTMDAWIAALPGFVSDANTLAANLNSIAAGGAYAIPYTYKAYAAVGFAAGGVIALTPEGGAQTATTTIYVDVTNGAGKSVAATLDTFDDSTSSVKGHILIMKQGDPSKWLLFSVSAVTTSTYYRAIAVTLVNSSSASPFTVNDTVMLCFQRTGDKGDPASLTSVLWVRDEKASGTAGGSAVVSTYVTRTLNTIKKNSISGASVSSNQITLPAGTYRATAFAPAYNVSAHQAYLYNVTDAVTQVVGTSAYTSSTTVTTQSVIGEAEFTLAASKVFEIRHWTSAGTATTGLGTAVSSGQGEVYTQVFIEKVA